MEMEIEKEEDGYCSSSALENICFTFECNTILLRLLLLLRPTAVALLLCFFFCFLLLEFSIELFSQNAQAMKRQQRHERKFSQQQDNDTFVSSSVFPSVCLFFFSFRPKFLSIFCKAFKRGGECQKQRVLCRKRKKVKPKTEPNEALQTRLIWVWDCIGVCFFFFSSFFFLFFVLFCLPTPFSRSLPFSHMRRIFFPPQQ